MKANIHVVSYLVQFFLEWEMFQTKSCTENHNTFYFNNLFFKKKSCRLWDNVEKYCTAGQVTDNNMVHAHCMPDTKGYKHTLGIHNTYYFSIAAMDARKPLSVTLYVHCLSIIWHTLYPSNPFPFCLTNGIQTHSPPI